MQALSACLGYSRQAYYKRCAWEQKRQEQAVLIRAKVLEIRARQPRVGARKLQRHLGNCGISVGRDDLLGLLRQWDLLVKPKRNYKRTTNSQHPMKKHKNLIRDTNPSRPNQIYVADITYLNTWEGYGYLFLITDMFSRKIVGHTLSQSLAFEGAYSALHMALAQRQDPHAPLIHHSDRGLQYCHHEYVGLLCDHNAQSSMTEQDHVYENALAERVNGILKTEFLLNSSLPSFLEAQKQVRESIDIYNKERLHTSLGYQTPEKVHQQTNPLRVNHDSNKDRGSKVNPTRKSLSPLNKNVKKHCQLF